MKSSVRGSIRKAPSVISWVCSFVNLNAWQRLDAGSMIKAWLLGVKTIQYIVRFGKENSIKFVFDFDRSWVVKEQ